VYLARGLRRIQWGRWFLKAGVNIYHDLLTDHGYKYKIDLKAQQRRHDARTGIGNGDLWLAQYTSSLNCHTPSQELPENGIYFFFEDGELIDLGSNGNSIDNNSLDNTLERVVRLVLIGLTVGSGSGLNSTTEILPPLMEQEEECFTQALRGNSVERKGSRELPSDQKLCYWMGLQEWPGHAKLWAWG